MEKCHFIGIGGIGMSGLARMLLQKSIPVTGSDLHATYVTEGLVKEGARIFIGHSSANVSENTTVVYSTDIKKDNPEYLTALKLKCPLLHRSDLLLSLTQGSKTLAITGTHGKTTTSSLLANVLICAKKDPSYAIGGILNEFQSNAKYGNGEFFVLEADESDGTFLKYHPYGAILTNIDCDHMNHFKTEESLIDSFRLWVEKIVHKNHFFWCGEDERLKKLQLPGISYGFSEECSLRAQNITQKGWMLEFDVCFNDRVYHQVQLALIGQHNILNALAVFGLALSFGIEEEYIRLAFKSFQGVKRRLEKKGEISNVLFLDDYAHHPTEIKTTLEGLRNVEKERRILAIYQPHRYTRTRDTLEDFQQTFDSVDEVWITEIYSAGEEEIVGITHEDLIAKIIQDTHLSVKFVPRSEVVAKLAKTVRPHDVVITLGAGDITKVCNETLEELKTIPPKKWSLGFFFGGQSVEHEISLLSAYNILRELNSEFYEIHHFGITQQGLWLEGNQSLPRLQALSISHLEKPILEGPISQQVLESLYKCDIFFPILHGSYGEDGIIQGLFEILNKPYVGADHCSAAIAMDKAITKKLMIANEIPTAPFVSFSKDEWKDTQQAILNTISKKLSYPLFVKPVHLGSSVGVKKTINSTELFSAIKNAFFHDTHVLVENEIEGRELEFSLFGNEDITVYPPGEICNGGQFYDYAAKYGNQAMPVEYEAVLTEAQKQEGMMLAKKAYRAIHCTGYARIDFFLDRCGKFWLNEINPIPGFTKNSLYPKICAAHGLKISSLLDKLIILSLHRKRQKQSCSFFRVR